MHKSTCTYEFVKWITTRVLGLSRGTGYSRERVEQIRLSTEKKEKSMPGDSTHPSVSVMEHWKMSLR